MKLGKKLLDRLSARTDLPLEYAAGMPRVELDGLHLLRVEQHQGLAVYEPEQVVVRGLGASLRVRGAHLTLEQMTAKELKLRGDIFAIEVLY